MSIESLVDEFTSLLEQGELPAISEFANRIPKDANPAELYELLLRREVAIRLGQSTEREQAALDSDLKRRYDMLPEAIIEQVIAKFRDAPTLIQDLEAKTIQDDGAPSQGTSSHGTSSRGTSSLGDADDAKTEEATILNDARTIGGVGPDKTNANLDQATVTGIDPGAGAHAMRRAKVDPAKRFGDYELIREIARGGMGVVYQARQLKLNRTCALKMILSGNLAGEQEVQRFYAEAESAANLSHSGIVPVYEVGEVEGQHFFSMGFVEGNSLGQEVADGPLEATRAARLTRDVAEAIGYAHDHGLIHRDLKPANVLIDKDGTPKVTDFGLAKQIKGDSDLTATGQILGTPSYMPPEQATGDAQQVDERADVYALGGILYCLLTGRPPFQASTPMDTLIQVMESEPVPPMRLNPLVPKDLETICLKCLVKEPHRRFANAQELVAELDRFLSDEPILSRPIGRLERGWRWCKKRPVIAGLSGSLALLLMIVAIAGPIVAIQQSQLRATAEQDRRDAEASEQQANEWARVATERQEAAESSERRARHATEVAEAERQAALRELYASNISLAHREWKNNNVKHARQLLARCPPEMRNWEYDYLQRLVNQESMVMQGLDRTLNLGIDRFRHELLALGISGGQWVTKRYSLRTGTEVGSIAASQLLSPNGQFCALVRPDHLEIKRADDNRTVRELPIEKPGEARGAAFSPDGTLLAIAMPDGNADGMNLSDVFVYNVLTGREVAKLPGVPPAFPFARIAAAPHGFLMPMAMSQDNRTLVLGAPFPPCVVQVWDLESESKTHEFLEHRSAVNSVCLSADGKRIASAGADTVNLWDLEVSETPLRLQGHLGQIYDVVFSPDGETVATGGWDRTARVWSTADGREIATFRGSQSAIVDLAFDNDGADLIAASTDGDIRVWQAKAIANPSEKLSEEVFKRLSTGNELNERLRRGLEALYASQLNSQESSVVGVAGGPSQCVAVSPDGRRVATAGHDEKVRVWDAERGELMHEFDSFIYIHGMHFDPTGQYLAFPNGKLAVRVLNRMVPGWAWVEIRDVETGELAHKSRVIDRPISSVTYSRDGKRIAAACGLHAIYAPQVGVTNNKSGQVRVWDIESNDEVWVQESHMNMAAGVSFSADDRLLASTGMDAVVRIWNAETGELAKEMTTALANTCAFSANGKYIAAACTDGVVRVWDASTFELTQMLEAHHGNIQMVAFSPDGSRLFSAGSDATVTVWDPENGRELLTLLGHTAEVATVAMDQLGQRLASAGADGFVKLWEGGSVGQPGGESFTVEVFEDAFERDKLGENWVLSSAESSIDKGAARTTIKSVPNRALNVDITIGSLNLSELKLPDEVEVEFDLWFDEPMGFQVGFVDELSWHGEYLMSLGAPNPFDGVMDTQVMVQSGYVSFKEIASVPYTGLTPQQRHHVVVRRTRDQIRATIDGEEVLSATLRTILNPRLSINTVYGSIDSHGWIDNLVVRTTPSSKLRFDARLLLEQLFDEHILPSRVREALEQEPSISDELARVAHSLVNEFSIEDAQLTERLRQLSRLDSPDQVSRELGLELATASVALDERDPDRLLLKGYWLVMNDRDNEAQEALQAAEDGFLERWNYHPGPPALLAICASEQDADQRAGYLAQARARFRSRMWSNDPISTHCMQLVKQRLPELHAGEPSESERLVQQLVAAKQAIWLETEDEPLRQLMSEDCQILELRPGAARVTDRELGRERYLNGSVAMLTHTAERTLQFSAPDVTPTESGYEIGWDTIVELNDFTMKIREEFTCDREDGAWQVTHFTTQIRYRRDARETIDYAEDVDELEEAVERSRNRSNQDDLIGRLNQAGRSHEAYELAKRLAESDPQNRQRQIQYANYALFSYNVDEYLAVLNACLPKIDRGEEMLLDDFYSAQARVLLELERFEELDRLFTTWPGDSEFKRRRRLLMLRTVTRAMADQSSVAAPSVESFWQRHVANWLEGLDDPQPVEARLSTWLDAPSHWVLIGPYPSGPDFRGFDKPFPIELANNFSEIKQLADPNAALRVLTVLPGDRVDLRQEVADRENALTYAYAEISVDDAVDAQIRFGSDDGAQVFHNGEKIHDQRVHRVWRESRDRINVRLQSGLNRFLVKVDQAGGEWAFSFDVCDRQGWPLPVQWREFDEADLDP